jgi:hypothetical protein
LGHSCFRAPVLGALLFLATSLPVLADCPPAPQLTGDVASSPSVPREFPPSGPALRREYGVHYGAPLRLSAHIAHVVPVRRDTVEHVEGLELLGEIGLAGLRVGLGWAERGRTYYNGQSATVSVIRTVETVLDPLSVPENRTLLALGYRMIGLGVTLRGEVLYDLGSTPDPWGLGWSAGVSW